MSASALSNIQNQVHNASKEQIPEPTYPEFENKFILHPKEIEQVWKSQNPKEDMAAFFVRLVKVHPEFQTSDYMLEDFEDRWGKEEQNIIAEFSLQNLAFFKSEAKVTDNYALAQLINTFTDMLMIGQLQGQDQYYKVGERNSMLQTALKSLFEEKLLNKPQVAQILAYFERTIIKHLPLFWVCFQSKRTWVDKKVRVLVAKQQYAGNLSTDCKEIVEERPEDYNSKSQHEFYQAEEGAQQEQQEEEESDVDPEDPMYGLDQRLRNMNLDDDTRRIIKEKLEEANNRVKNALEDRQRNLDSKLAGDKGAPKKK